ncbi:MAG: hypothetical protein QM764_19705 [Chitinophagaceae bacterium]
METMKNAAAIRPILSQTKNNTTTWVGHLQDETVDHFGGQTFKCPDEGYLDNIQVYASMIQRPGNIQLTLYEFDETQKHWNLSIANSSVIATLKDEGEWLSFMMPRIYLSKNKTYGFRLQSKDAMVGIGEFARGNHEPCLFGQEWNADSNNRDGVFFSWFSLAFKIEMAA